MAPRIKVPADFGREHINSDVHGNLILKLKDGEQIRANSMIMSLNSPVINNLISDLCQVNGLVVIIIDQLQFFFTWPKLIQL